MIQRTSPLAQQRYQNQVAEEQKKVVEVYEEQPSISYQEENVSFIYENPVKPLNPEKDEKDLSFSHD